MKMDKNRELEEIRCQKNKIFGELKSSYSKMSVIASRGGETIDDIDEEFEKATKLDKRDMKFLFLAVALQCTRILLQPKMDLEFKKIPREGRLDAGREGIKEQKKRKIQAEVNRKNNISSCKYPDMVNIFEYPVPYDAMKGTERIVIPGVSPVGKQLYAGNHHSATLGHDPVAGLIFGPINILTRTITFKNPLLQTCEVHFWGGTNEQCVTDDVLKVTLIKMLMETASEDVKRIPAAVGRHMLHIESDKYCRQGLPVPFVSAKEAQRLLDSGWNSYELHRLSEVVGNNLSVIGTQAFLSMLINVMIETAHKLTYQEGMGISREQYSVKTHRILELSNVIASLSDIIGVALGCAVGVATRNHTVIKKSLEYLDIGGFLVTIKRLITDELWIRQIKMEYLKNQWYDYVITELQK
jgi:hypothetical protein